MAISNELSSEIAVAILSDKKSPQELNRLKDIILRVHSALQEMSQEVRATRLEKKSRKTTASDSTVR
jgi:predicted house-cleaning noncanonical NTP pyrophosphatase (MazG superfamily)